MSFLAQQSTRSSRHYPPGPAGHWLLGTLPAFRHDLLQTMENWLERYGDAVRYRYFWRRHGYLFCHPKHYQHILQDNNHIYTKFPSPIFALLQTIGGKGLLTSDGELWLRQRRLMQPAFHRKIIAHFNTSMTEATNHMLDRWQAVAASERAIDVGEEMIRLALEVVGRTLFSVDLSGQVETVRKAFGDITRQFRELSSHPLGVYFGLWLLNFPFLPGTRRLQQNVALLDEVVNKIITERRVAQERGGGERQDLLDMLMQAHDDETGERMSDRQLRDEVLTIMLTGHETVAVALAATFSLLSEHPAVRAEVEREMDQVLSGRSPTMDDLEALRYSHKVIDESLRLYPPIYAIPRTAQDADRIDGYDVDKGAIVILSPYLTHRHPAFWQDPEKFDPDRFSPEEKEKRPRYAFIPFGIGPRMCIGSNFAMTEMMMVLAMVTQRYQLDLAPGNRLKMKPLITLHPRQDILMTVQSR